MPTMMSCHAPHHEAGVLEAHGENYTKYSVFQLFQESVWIELIVVETEN